MLIPHCLPTHPGEDGVRKVKEWLALRLLTSNELKGTLFFYMIQNREELRFSFRVIRVRNSSPDGVVLVEINFIYRTYGNFGDTARELPNLHRTSMSYAG